MYLNVKIKGFSVVPILAALLVPSLQTDGNSTNKDSKCHAPETYANTMCQLESNETYPVTSGTNLTCFCSYNGEDLFPSENENNLTQITLQCLDGTWDREAPLCGAGNTIKKQLQVQLINMDSFSFSPRNMTLFPFFASGMQSVTLYTIGCKDKDIQKELEGLLGMPTFLEMESNLTFEGYSFSSHHFNCTDIIENVESLKKFYGKVLHKPVVGAKWTSYDLGTEHNKITSKRKEITLNITHGQPALITGAKLELSWDLEVSNITIDGKDAMPKIEWNHTRFLPQLILQYPYQNKNTTTIEINITSIEGRYEWPLHDIRVFGERGNLIELSSELVCGNPDFCKTMKEFERHGRHFWEEKKGIIIKLNISRESLVNEIILGFYEPIDIKLKTSTGNIPGSYKVMKKNSFITFHYPEPNVIHSDIELTLESSIETSNWPIKGIKLKGMTGHPKAWCPELKNITKIITTADMCIHFSGKIQKGQAVHRETYHAAIQQCSLINGSLVEPQDKHLQGVLENNCENFMFYWIGLSHYNSSEKWQWNSGGPLVDENNFVTDCGKLNVSVIKNNDPVKEKKIRDTCQESKNETCVVLQREYDFKWVPRNCGKECQYICQSGYIGCGIPHKKKIAQMNITEMDGKFPMKVQYTCPDGFKLEGIETRTCSDKGVWSHEAPTCEETTKTSTWADVTDSTSELNGSDHESTSANSIDEASNVTSDQESGIIKTYASLVIIICTTVSVVLIIVSIVLCWKRRCVNNNANGLKTLNGSDLIGEKAKKTVGKEDLPDQKTSVKLSSLGEMNKHENLPLGAKKEKTVSLSHQKFQQEMDMVESDIYDSYEPRNFTVAENDMYGTM